MQKEGSQVTNLTLMTFPSEADLIGYSTNKLYLQHALMPFRFVVGRFLFFFHTSSIGIIYIYNYVSY